MTTDSSVASSPEPPGRPTLLISDLVLTGLGLSTTVLTALALAWLNLRAHFAPFAFTAWGVIPIGAMLCGLVAASGYALGARVLGRRPGGLARAGIVVSGPLAYVLVVVFEYVLLDVRGIPVSSVMSLATFVDTIIRGASIKFGGFAVAPHLGAAGYVLAFIQAAGFLVGGLLVFGLAGMKRPSCARCGRYLMDAVTVNGSGTAAELSPQFTYARKLLSEGNPNAAAAVIGAFPQTDASHRLQLETRLCQACELNYYQLALLQWGSPAPVRGKQAGPQWIPMGDYSATGEVAAVSAPSSTASTLS